MKIVICEFMDESAVDALRQRFEVRYDPALVDRRAELERLLADAEALVVRNRTQVDGGLLDAAPRLRVVGRLGVGLDNIDVAACEARGVAVIPATGANALAVAEYVVACGMMLLRGAYLSSDAVASGAWPRTRLSEGRETGGKTLGLVGFGGIGRLTARLAKGLGMQVVAYDPILPRDAPVWEETGVKRLDLDMLLAQSDVVSLHVPLTDATRGLMNMTRIAAMKPGAVLINTARGGIVDEMALAEALRQGRLAGAALDVFGQEPLPAGSALANVPNLVLTPHIGGVTRESNERVSALIAEKVADRLLELDAMEQA
ncbi:MULTISPECIES: hydroxyacid dehydrogenase [unclassified Massilia]|uniref:hydroxyacid dehydrogenase n=1 Tax=unclassified Massilia TaxID=2609279 RepID=UPI001B842744|nr:MULTISPECIES: hydroxyacid dehydrogenase [unclassified Massilia]MBQ5941749.1 hydroxyacid dehydrogenase [Massilia sp. AB1]MBQ5961611.1 hydroxyacid dehydrogenase [Massilia sp. ZL223]